ncbi:hypothetical protein SDC9_137782 [bioreactor metagenome]|uniref:Uncharacterized protein n=1 Tax=bioreactor metagenome TaxID=1076179 RepID=A0A645DMJ0_9ZZZZ
MIPAVPHIDVYLGFLLDFQGLGGHEIGHFPVAEPVGQLCAFHIRLPHAGAFCDGPEIPAEGRPVIPQLAVGPGDPPHRGAPLLPPGSGGQRQMPLKSLDAFFPHALVHVFPAQIVGHPVVLRGLGRRQLQKGKIGATGFCWVRVVIEHHARREYLPLRPMAHIPQAFMDGMFPPVGRSGVGFKIVKLHIRRAVRLQAPVVEILGHTDPGCPHRLQRSPPARMEHLVQIGAYADVHVRGDMVQGEIAGNVKPPG